MSPHYLVSRDPRVMTSYGAKLGMYPDSPLDGNPTGRNPHWTESPLDGIPTKILCSGDSVPWCSESPLDGIPAAQLKSRVLMYFNLALQRHYEDKLHSSIKSVAKMRIHFPKGEVISS